MCGRYEFSSEEDINEIQTILQEIDADFPEASFKTGEIFPTGHAPVYTASDGKPGLGVMQWGFPKWDGKGVIINAKSETAAEKRTFSRLLEEKRCVIPSTGFYEWYKKDKVKRKDKYLFQMKDSPMLYMAGLYNKFQDGEDIRECFVIFTRAANRSIQDIHDRMPVILHKNELENWLMDKNFIEPAFQRDHIILQRTLMEH